MASSLSLFCLLIVCVSLPVCIVGPKTSIWDACNCRFGDWGSWSSCTHTCGGGRQRRERKMWSYDKPGCDKFESCATSDMALDFRQCNANCFNGGTFRTMFSFSFCNCRTGTEGRCCETIVTCGRPSDISHGSVSGTRFQYNDIVRYSCDSKYNISGPSIRRCSSTGTWAPAVTPICQFVQSCESDPCQNGATCTNLPDTYTCTCAPSWSGRNCEVDVQPPVMIDCPADESIFTSDLVKSLDWTVPTFSDPLGNDVHVSSNYPSSSSVFPWGDFTVEYTATKPSNGLRTNCTFTFRIRPNPCPPVTPRPKNIVVCNGWRKDFSRVCLTFCVDGFAKTSGSDVNQIYNCGASGNWIPGIDSVGCQVDATGLFGSSSTGLNPPNISNCSDTTQKKSAQEFYMNALTSSRMSIIKSTLCDPYPELCMAQHVDVLC